RHLVVAAPPGLTGLGHAGRPGHRGPVAGRPATRARHGHRHPGRLHGGDLDADLPGRPADPGDPRDRVGALRDRDRRLWPVLLVPGPARRVRGGRLPHADRGPGVGPRLAGEMHDVVTHRLSMMVLQAGALGITATDEATRRAAEELRAAGVQALDELRDLVGILRTEPEGDQPPSAAGLAALVAESTAVGTPAEIVEEGDPALASPVVGRTAYRIVRAALTNVRTD